MENLSGTGMTIETGTTGGEVAVEVGKDMIVTSTVRGTGIIVAEAGAAVQVLTDIETVGEEEMMRSDELEADHLIGLNHVLFSVFFSHGFSCFWW